ncbi:hypothetical protein B0H10DRAFT_1948445 [Mycena sp. CBHHK59/15]|nr:hypothetical protein B0H10DRAFT_1948445 [Mycena sp. CBHHK59/15]
MAELTVQTQDPSMQPSDCISTSYLIPKIQIKAQMAISKGLCCRNHLKKKKGKNPPSDERVPECLSGPEALGVFEVGINVPPKNIVIMLVAGIDWKVFPSVGAGSQERHVHETTAPDHRQRSDPILGLFQKPLTLLEPTALFKGTLKIMINKHRPLLYGRAVNYLISDEVLFQSAFQPRQINFAIESGKFHRSWNYAAPRFRALYGLRLTFSASPYPPMDSLHKLIWIRSHRAVV